MIHTSLSFLKDQVNSFVALKDPLNTAGTLVKPVVLSNIVDQENKLINISGDHILMTLINTEEETVGKSQLPYLKTPDDKLYVVNPDIKLNLYIQFAAYSDNAVGPLPVYERALRLIDQVIFFFQLRNVFTSAQYPALLEGNIEKIIVDPVSLTFEQLNHLWATLGAKYMPSVTYKCRMLTFRETIISPERSLVKELSTTEIVK